MKARSCALLLSAAFTVLCAHVAIATPVAGLAPPTIDINGTPIDLGALACSPRGDEVACSGENLQGNGFVLETWSLVLNPDPSINATFNLTNLSAATQTFILTVTLPVSPTGPSLSATGSVGTGTLSDMNGNGATLTDDGSSIYSALIDGSPVRTLLDPPQSFTTSVDVTGLPIPVSIGPESFGPEILAQSANLSIGMRVQYTLTAGDNVALPIFFSVQPVPEPGTLVLVGSGLASLVGARRRGAARTRPPSA